jgi:ATP-dependent helicase/nuclease subunit B
MLEKNLTRSGLLLKDPKVLQAMEHSVLEQPHFLPVKLGRDGALTEGPGGVLASAGQLGELGKYVERLLGELLEELSSGNVDADPCTRGGADESVCRSCDFAAACHFEDGRGRDRLRYLRKTAAEDFWKLVAVKGGAPDA